MNRIVVLIFLISFCACKSRKLVQKQNPNQRPPVVTQPKVEPEEKPEEVKEEQIEKVEIVEVETKPEPIPTNRLCVILPIGADKIGSAEYMDIRSTAMMDYYKGFQIAFEEKQAQIPGLQEIMIKDCGANSERIEQVIQECKALDVNYIIGGKGTSTVNKLADYMQARKGLYASAWQTNSSSVGQNEHYVQLNPRLETHMAKILAHARRNAPSDARHIIFTTPKYSSRVAAYKETYKELFGEWDGIEVLEVDPEGLQKLELEEMQLQVEEENQKFVFYFTPTRDYDLIHDMIRALQVNNLAVNSVIYGITDWNNTELHSIMDAFDVRVSSMFDNVIDRRYMYLESKYYNDMHGLPSDETYVGYNHALLMLDLIQAHQRKLPLAGLRAKAPGMSALLNDASFAGKQQMEAARTTSTYWLNNDLYLLGYKDASYYIIE